MAANADDWARWWEVAKAAWAKSGSNHASLVAAAIAFNSFLAFVPLLSAVVLTYGLVASPQKVAEHIGTLAQAMPENAAALISEQLQDMVDIARSNAGIGLLTAIAISLYGAVRGAAGVITGLNLIYEVEESRPLLRRAALAGGITAGLMTAFILASLAISVVNLAGSLLPDLGGMLHALLKIGFWTVAALAVSLLIALIYRYAPNRQAPDWRWMTPGSLIATLVWIAATLAFSVYVQNFGSYNATYGALGAVVIFLTWLYLSAYILLLGAELNQVLVRRKKSASRFGTVP